MTMSLIMTLVGLLAGIIKDLWMTKIESNQRREEMLLKRAGLLIKDRERAGRIKDKGVHFTRRLIAISFVFSIVIAPVVFGFVYPHLAINVPIESTVNGFWPFFDSTKVIKYVALTGVSIPLQLIDAFLLIIGFYFGSAGSKK